MEDRQRVDVHLWDAAHVDRRRPFAGIGMGPFRIGAASTDAAVMMLDFVDPEEIAGDRVLVGQQPELAVRQKPPFAARSEEHTSELQSLMRISYAVFCLKKKNKSITVQVNYLMT